MQKISIDVNGAKGENLPSFQHTQYNLITTITHSIVYFFLSSFPFSSITFFSIFARSQRIWNKTKRNNTKVLI